MSSTIRKFSQIPVRTKYLLVIADPSGGTVEGGDGDYFGTAGASIVRVPNGSFMDLTSINTVAGITASGVSVTPVVNSLGPPAVSYTGRLFKDLGRQITVYDDEIVGSPHVATYRECQLVGVVATEGVPEDSPAYGADYYVRVWAADGTNVVVARTG